MRRSKNNVPLVQAFEISHAARLFEPDRFWWKIFEYYLIHISATFEPGGISSIQHEPLTSQPSCQLVVRVVWQVDCPGTECPCLAAAVPRIQHVLSQDLMSDELTHAPATGCPFKHVHQKWGDLLLQVGDGRGLQFANAKSSRYLGSALPLLNQRVWKVKPNIWEEFTKTHNC